MLTIGAASALAALMMVFAGAALAQAQAAPAVQSSVSTVKAVGTVTHLSGVLVAKRADGSTKIVSVKSEVQEGDTLATEQDAYARIKFADGGEVVMRPTSQLNVASYSFDAAKPASDNVLLNMLKGGLRSVTGLIGKRNRDMVKISTLTATIGIRGTHFGLLLCQGDCGAIPTVSGQPPANGLHVDVADGAVVLSNPAGQQVLNAGQFGYVGSPTTPPVQVPAQQGIQVTMPAVISKNEGGGRSLGKGRDNECAVK